MSNCAQLFVRNLAGAVAGTANHPHQKRSRGELELDTAPEQRGGLSSSAACRTGFYPCVGCPVTRASCALRQRGAFLLADTEESPAIRRMHEMWAAAEDEERAR